MNRPHLLSFLLLLALVGCGPQTLDEQYDCVVVEADLIGIDGAAVGPFRAPGEGDWTCLVASGGWWFNEKGAPVWEPPRFTLSLRHAAQSWPLRLQLHPEALEPREERLQIGDFRDRDDAETGRAYAQIGYEGQSTTAFNFAPDSTDLDSPEVSATNAILMTFSLEAPNRPATLELQLDEIEFERVEAALVGWVGRQQLTGRVVVSLTPKAEEAEEAADQ